MSTNISSEEYRNSWRPWVLLLCLIVAYVLSSSDRFVIGVLTEAIKQHYKLSDTQVSLLSGASVFLAYCVAFIPVGLFADKVNRTRMIAAGVGFWTLATAACGVVGSYSQMLIARICVGLGEGVLPPTAHSLIANGFSPKRHALALGLFGIGGTIGGSLAVLVGGYLLGILTPAGGIHLPLIGWIEPWQATFVLICAPGFLLVPLVLCFREPPRQFDVRDRKRSNFGALKTFYASHWPTILPHHLAMGFFNGGMVCTLSWAPPLLIRAHQWPVEKIGVVVGFANLLGVAIGLIGGGAVSDMLVRYGVRGRMMLCAVTGPVAAAAISVWTLGDATSAILIGLTIYLGCCMLPYSVSGAALQSVVPDEARGTAAAVYLLASNIPAAFSPTVVALLSDHVFTQADGIRYSVFAVGLVCVLLGGGLALLSAVQFPRVRKSVTAPGAA